jgi:YHS domain-containing protein
VINAKVDSLCTKVGRPDEEGSMSSLEEFRAELKSQLALAANAPHWQSSDAEAYMAALRSRRLQFEEAARSLVATVIKPRLETVAGFFPSARALADEQACRCWCWFASSDRFPVIAKVEFVLEHDESVEHLFVRYEACLMPVFIRFQPHDKLTTRLDAMNPEQSASWVEERTYEFPEAYLHHDRGQDDLDEDILTDPVCGMRLRRSDVRAQADYRGHPYFFCSAECRDKFERKPEGFVTVRTM